MVSRLSYIASPSFIPYPFPTVAYKAAANCFSGFTAPRCEVEVAVYTRVCMKLADDARLHVQRRLGGLSS
ncbi:hypothetical protein EMIT0373P_40710 [Pseudomonas chlororaphis]